MFDDALEYVGGLFYERYAANGVPKLLHSLQVVEKLNDWGFSREENGDLWCMAMLADVVEDFDISFFELESKFGKAIATGIRTLRCRKREDDEDYYQYLKYLSERWNLNKDSRVSLVIVQAASIYCKTRYFIKTKEFTDAIIYWGHAQPFIKHVLGRVDCQFSRFVEGIRIMDYSISLLEESN